MWTWLSRILGTAAEEPAAGIEPSRPATGAHHANPSHPATLARLQRILDTAGVQMEKQSLEQLLDELQRSRKIEAIKRIRTEGRPRLGLKEAKDIADSF